MEWTNELVLPDGDVAASDCVQGSIFFVGNATVVLSYVGFTILTGPNFLHRGDHVHLGRGMTAARRTDPALELEALPPIDSCFSRTCTRTTSTARWSGGSTIACLSSPRPRRRGLIQRVPCCQGAEHVGTPETTDRPSDPTRQWSCPARTMERRRADCSLISVFSPR